MNKITIYRPDSVDGNVERRDFLVSLIHANGGKNDSLRYLLGNREHAEQAEREIAQSFMRPNGSAIGERTCEDYSIALRKAAVERLVERGFLIPLSPQEQVLLRGGNGPSNPENQVYMSSYYYEQFKNREGPYKEIPLTMSA